LKKTPQSNGIISKKVIPIKHLNLFNFYIFCIGFLGLIGNTLYLFTLKEDTSFIIKSISSSPIALPFTNPGIFLRKKIYLSVEKSDTIISEINEKNMHLFIDANTYKAMLFAQTTDLHKWNETVQKSYCDAEVFKKRLSIKSKITSLKIEYLDTNNSILFTRQYTCNL
jgi:hypothetical protein